MDRATTNGLFDLLYCSQNRNLVKDNDCHAFNSFNIHQGQQVKWMTPNLEGLHEDEKERKNRRKREGRNKKYRKENKNQQRQKWQQDKKTKKTKKTRKARKTKKAKKTTNEKRRRQEERRHLPSIPRHDRSTHQKQDSKPEPRRQTTEPPVTQVVLTRLRRSGTAAEAATPSRRTRWRTLSGRFAHAP